LPPEQHRQGDLLGGRRQLQPVGDQLLADGRAAALGQRRQQVPLHLRPGLGVHVPGDARDGLGRVGDRDQPLGRLGPGGGSCLGVVQPGGQVLDGRRHRLAEQVGPAPLAGQGQQPVLAGRRQGGHDRLQLDRVGLGQLRGPLRALRPAAGQRVDHDDRHLRLGRPQGRQRPHDRLLRRPLGV
ncbi:MAG: hypothetical protein AVDCRST_MAG64-1083, partial [uncultured Phycisphaerae bacterium]